jgi:hypothetical protein
MECQKCGDLKFYIQTADIDGVERSIAAEAVTFVLIQK